MPTRAGVAQPLLLATRSAGKLRELRPMFEERGLRVVDLVEAGIAEGADEDGLEVFETFEENALAKARWFHARSGMPTVADDSGLEVRALGGRPGVRSKRWSGRADLRGEALDEANNAMLLQALEGAVDRRARFVCVAALVDGVRGAMGERTWRGEVRGVLLREGRGAGGFGYDPYFAAEDTGGVRSFGELTGEEKSRVSHRARAFALLLGELAAEK
ncbi:MAG: Nucleoside-triphosphatase rdgB [Gemmatimonadetes bacterium]|nr:Nucleoside-triphosphatase rdgB [Gemmatimonadota bacterium]